MGDGKPTVPENMMSTLTLSGYNSAHTSYFAIFRHISRAVAVEEHCEPFRSVNYVRMTASSPIARKVFYGKTISLFFLHHYNVFTTKHTLYKALIEAFRPDSGGKKVNRFMPAVAHKFI